MNAEMLVGVVTRCRWGAVVGAVLLVVSAAGCGSSPLFQKTERIEEGHVAARREAEADVRAQVAAGVIGSEGTTSSIPSLEADTGRVLMQAPEAPPATAPAEADFDNDNAGHLLARCRDRVARQQWFDAVGDCRRSYELNPSSIEPQVELMRLLVSLQSFSDAEKAAKKVLAVRPGDPVALYYLAWSYRGRDRYAEAISVLKQAVAASPSRVEYVQALGMTYCLDGNYGKGIETLERAQAMKPDDARIQAMIKEALTQLSNKLAPYHRYVREKPDSYDTQAALAYMYQKYGLSQKALVTYDAALAKIPVPFPEQDSETKTMAAQIYYNRGVVYRDLARPDLGEAALWQSMQLDPKLAPMAWYYIGLCRYDAGKFDSSIEALRKSVDLAPDVAENRAALADSYAKAGNASLATEQRNAVLAIQARAAEAKQEIARQEARGGKTEEEAAAAAAAAVAAGAPPDGALAPEEAPEPEPAPASPLQPTPQPAAQPAAAPVPSAEVLEPAPAEE